MLLLLLVRLLALETDALAAGVVVDTFALMFPNC
jgi:hypothetical protein